MEKPNKTNKQADVCFSWLLSCCHVSLWRNVVIATKEEMRVRFLRKNRNKNACLEMNSWERRNVSLASDPSNYLSWQEDVFSPLQIFSLFFVPVFQPFHPDSICFLVALDLMPLIQSTNYFPTSFRLFFTVKTQLGIPLPHPVKQLNTGPTVQRW